MSISESDPVAVSLLEKAKQLVDRDDLGARLVLAAAIARVGEAVAVRPVVVGGTALDFYVGRATKSAGFPPGWETSRDVDVVALEVSGARPMQRLQEALVATLGFTADGPSKNAEGTATWGRGMTVPGVPIGIEVVDDELHLDPRAERVFVVEVEGQPVALRGPEDTLLGYAESGWATWNAREWERALAVWRSMKRDMDADYLREQAARRKMAGVLQEAMDQRPIRGPSRPLF